jgi:hypothetical protein
MNDASPANIADDSVVRDQSSPAPDLDGKEVAGGESFTVGFKENRPRDPPAPTGRGLGQMVLKNPVHRTTARLYIHISQRSLYSRVAPAWIFHRHSDHVDAQGHYEDEDPARLGGSAAIVCTVQRLRFAGR